MNDTCYDCEYYDEVYSYETNEEWSICQRPYNVSCPNDIIERSEKE